MIGNKNSLKEIERFSRNLRSVLKKHFLRLFLKAFQSDTWFWYSNIIEQGHFGNGVELP